MSKHAPIPWMSMGSVVVPQGGPGSTIARAVVLKGKTRREDNAFEDLGAANAAFIVRACNSHEELLEALKQSAALMEDAGGFADTVAKADAAIAKAEGNE